MKKYNYKEAPFTVYGVPFFEKTGVLERVPERVCKLVSHIEPFAKRCPGGRIRFKTDSENINVTIKLAYIGNDPSMSYFSAYSGDIWAHQNGEWVYLGLIKPIDDISAATSYGSFRKLNTMEDVVINFPRNVPVDDINIELDDSAKVSKPSPYTYSKPVLFYGSSITEGACSSRVSNSYPALLSRWLDCDYYNLGFSGNARGETELADYINEFDLGVFVLDYDHNAPDIPSLEYTHERFFKRIREKQPDLPIIMMTRPDFDYGVQCPERREIIRRTYNNAIANGDKNVYFIDGQTFFGDDDRHACTADRIHPNDLGAFRMAKTIMPILKNALDK